MITEKINISKEDFELLFHDKEEVKTHIVYKLINRANNQKLLETVPFVQYLDLAIVFYYVFPSVEDEYRGFLIKNVHMLSMGLTVNDLMSAASENTEKLLGIKMQGIFSTIAEIVGEEGVSDFAKIEDSYVPLQVLSNRLGVFGASVILYKDAIKKIAEKMNSNIYIIPCSIHEVLIYREMKNCQIDISDIKEMITTVNQNEIPEDEILSDSLYYYSLESNTIGIA